ncbi:MAG: hypothetical protein EA401_05255 [Planctomycetota bacterium]|nr:MAG: hypothetical protein EA401_05255 [Planctomycetota bacterium]
MMFQQSLACVPNLVNTAKIRQWVAVLLVLLLAIPGVVNAAGGIVRGHGPGITALSIGGYPNPGLIEPQRGSAAQPRVALPRALPWKRNEKRVNPNGVAKAYLSLSRRDPAQLRG